MRLATRVVWAVCLVAMAGCTAAPSPSPTRTQRPSLAPPETPSASDLPGDLGAALFVEATSGNFTDLAQRTEVVAARLTVWDSGLVTGNVASLFDPAQYRSIQLGPAEFDELRSRLSELDLSTYIAQDVTGNPMACGDCNVQIIETDISGAVVEVAIGGPPGPGRGDPENVQAVSREVAGLLERLRGPEGKPWNGTSPTLQVGPPEAGG